MIGGEEMGRNRALVLGGGIAGLLCARVLAETFERVTVVDRDTPPEAPRPRGGVPQGRHVHALLARGVDAFEELFPGIVDELVARGALRGDALLDATWLPGGHRLRSIRSGLTVVSASRPLIEAVVRARVERLENVTSVRGTTAVGLVFDETDTRVCGVRLRPHGSTPVVHEAELVVDGSGRTSLAGRWLEAAGYEAPAEERIEVGIGYVTRTFRVAPAAMGGRVAVVHPRTKEHPRGAVALRIEGGLVMVSMTGYREHAPEPTARGFIAHAKSLTHRDIESVVTAGEPASEIARYAVEANLRRRFDALDRFPEGFVVMGDALCAFNPIYAQGMTVAALEALALRECVARGRRELGRRFFDATADLVTNVWRVTAANDMEMPGVVDRRPRIARVMSAWTRRVVAAAENDDSLSLAFVRVANLVDPSRALLSPRIFFAVLRRGVRDRARKLKARLLDLSTPLRRLGNRFKSRNVQRA